MNNLASIIICLAFFFPLQSDGQSCCSGGTPISGSLGIQNLDKGSWQFHALYGYLAQRSLVDGSTVLNDQNRTRHTHSILFRTSYAFSDRWAITGIIPWVREEERIDNAATGDGLTAAQGIGDLVAFVQFSLLDELNTGLILATGIKAPVGATERIDPETGLAINPEMQPGTGAWDIIFGAKYEARGIFRPTMAFSTNATFRITFSDERFNGLQTYEFGDEFQVFAGFADNFFAQLLTPSLNLMYRYELPDKIDGFTGVNTGGHWLHLVPGVDINFTPSFSITLTGEIPLYRSLDGVQLTTSYSLRIGLRYAIARSTLPGF